MVKILELRINKVRGLLDFRRNLDGQSLLIRGPNGSGKSGVVDAIEFLFAGHMSRLTGEGTGAVSLARHGHHVLYDREDSFVVANVDFQDGSEPQLICRRLARPSEPECSPETLGRLARLQRTARYGQLCLTRRDILRFIAAEGRSRADSIQALLNLSPVEEMRQRLVEVRNGLERTANAANVTLDKAISNLTELLPENEYSNEAALTEVNRLRAVLAAPPLEAPQSSNILVGVVLVSGIPGSKSFNPTSVQRPLELALGVIAQDKVSEIRTLEQSLRLDLVALSRDKRIVRLFDELDLVRRGLDLVGDTTVHCPLCDAEWDEGRLVEHLKEKHESAVEARKLTDQLNGKCTSLINVIAPLRQHLFNASNVMESASDGIFDLSWKQALSLWASHLEELEKSLEKRGESYVQLYPTSSVFEEALLPGDVEEAIKGLIAAAKSATPTLSPEQDATQKLTQWKERLKAYEEAADLRTRAIESASIAKELAAAYESARNEVLDSLYERVSGRFASLYSQLHPHEADHFQVVLTPDRAAVQMSVAFDDLKMYPPNAVHSEGHQDSMGLCLFLALNDELSSSKSSLLVLDDVVTSLDTSHRSAICRMLMKEYPNRQFIITTHETNWAQQIQRSKLIAPDCAVEFSSWNVQRGPLTRTRLTLWPDIDADLKAGNVSEAALKLRRHCEEFYPIVAGSIRASIPASAGGPSDVGDVLNPVLDRLKNVLSRAVKSAESWGKHDMIPSIQGRESTRSVARTRLGEEWWKVNFEVHYNDWIKFTPTEFEPVVQTFRELESVFTCDDCEQLAEVIRQGNQDRVYKCPCGRVDFNLDMKT